MTAGSPDSSLNCVLPAGSSIRCVDGLSGLRVALIADAQRLSQNLRSNRKSKSKKSSPNSCESWGYIIDLSGHWATVFCYSLEVSGITAILFDTTDAQADAEELYRSGLLGSLGNESQSRFSIHLRLLLLSPVSEFRRVPLLASESRELKEAKEKLKSTDHVNENASSSRLYLNRNLLPFRRVVIQPILQASRDETCLARGVAVLLWLFGLTTSNDNLRCLQQFLRKAQEFEIEIATEAHDSNQSEDVIEAPQELEVSSQGQEVSSANADSCGHDSGDELDAAALWAAQRALFEPASRLIAGDGSPDRFGRETHCMVQAIPETKMLNGAVHSNSVDSENCSRRQQEIGAQLDRLGLLPDMPLNDTNIHATARDADEWSMLQAAVERWSISLSEDQKVRPNCRDADLDFSQISAHSCLLRFILYGSLRRNQSRPGLDVNIVHVPFYVLPFPKLFERLKLKDFVRESSESELESLRTLLLRLEPATEKHWGIPVSDFELGGGDSHSEFWNPVSTDKEVRPPRKLDMKVKHRGGRR